MEKDKTYAQIFKSTSIFGSIQVFNFLISILKNKVIYLFIGSYGVGVYSLFTNLINLVAGFSSVGLETSSIKFLNESNNKKNQSAVIVSLRNLLLITSSITCVIFMFFSKYISYLTFHDYQFSNIIKFSGIALLFRVLTIGENAILQGVQKVKFLAKANFYSNLIGLFITIPIFYIFRINAILPTLILTSIISFFFTLAYTRRIEMYKVNFKKLDIQYQKMLKLGSIMLLSSTLNLAVSFSIQYFISKYYGIESVGVYNTAFVFLNSYVGVLFTAMSMSYYPKISSVVDDFYASNNLIDKQILMGILLIFPLLVILQFFSEFILQLLFSKDFIIAKEMIIVGIFGMYFKVISFSLGYYLIAKTNNKIILYTTFAFNFLYLFASIFGYKYYNLKGIGIAFSLYYLVHLLVIGFFVHKRYEITMSRTVIKNILFTFLFAIICYYMNSISTNLIIKISFSLISIFYSIYQIKKRI